MDYLKFQNLFNMNKIILLLLAFMPLYTYAQNQAPCADEAHQQFSFWVGEWTVYKTGTDTIAGHSHIKNILGSCVIEENWKSANSPYEGKSFNTYNPQDSTWNQVWVDNGGATYHFKGKYKDNVVDMYGETPTKKGPLKFNMSFTYNRKDDTVRQVWKSSKNDGKTWDVAFDGTYKKR